MACTYEACILSFSLPSAILLTINADIGPSPQIVWGPTAWSLAAAVVQTIAGRCSDIFGRRNFILAGNLLGLVGECPRRFHLDSLACAETFQVVLLRAGWSFMSPFGELREELIDESRAQSVSGVIAGFTLTVLRRGEMRFTCSS